MKSNLASEKGMTTKDWSELSLPVLTEIGRRITQYRDFVWFGSVCRFWNLAASMDNFRSESTAAFLIIRCRHHGRPLLYDPVSRQPCRDSNEILDQPFRLSGEISSKGWVLEVRETDLKPLLWNHSTTIELPDFRCVRCYGDILSFHLRQFDISSDPSSTSDYAVILTAEVLYGRGGGHLDHGIRRGHALMTFLRHGQGGNLPRCNHPGWSVFRSSSQKIGCFKGLLATIHKDGSFDVRAPNYTNQLLPVPRFPNLQDCLSHKFMVESQNGLMVIVQLLDSSSVETKEFYVFELDWASKEWTQVEDLGCKALFLKTSQTPIFIDCNRFLANKIFSISSSKDADVKVEIYNLATNSFESPIQFPPCHLQPCLQAQWIFQTKKIKTYP